MSPLINKWAKKIANYPQQINLFVLLFLLIIPFSFKITIFQEAVSLNLNSVRLNGLFSQTATSISKKSVFCINEAEKIEHSLNKWVSGKTTNTRVWQKLALLNTWCGNIAEAARLWTYTNETEKDFIVRGINTDNIPNDSTFLNSNIWYTVGLKINPDIRDLWFYQGIYYLNQNQTAKAISTLQNSLQASDSFEVGLGDIYLQLAEIYSDEAMLEIALDNLEEALTVNDFENKEQSLIRTHYLRAEILNQLGQQAAAMEEYAVVLSLQKDHYWALVRMGQLIWKLNKDTEQAINYIEQAIVINNKPKMAYKILGNIYCDVGLTDKAITVYQEVLIRDPLDPVALKVVNSTSCRQSN